MSKNPEDDSLVAGAYLWFGFTEAKVCHLWRPDGGWREHDYDGEHPLDIVKGIPEVR